MGWTGITALNFVVTMTLDVCSNDDLQGKPEVLGKNTFSPFVCCKSFRNLVRIN